ncbi:PGN_0703 family putative restriction endonuclease [Brevundimonas sp. R86498]|uniref:PGN_0703 family putative restriction endonuclease n=1 Tax=Brevundimonas sp. R86498 TaxID=3093845 RepID=UPI0037CB3158
MLDQLSRSAILSRMTRPEFLPGVDAAHVTERLRLAGGKEIESGKLLSPESSAALAVNTFGWFASRPHLLPPFPGQAFEAPPREVEVEYCARFPWRGGRHPWLDAVVETPGKLIGVELKRCEPFRDRKLASLSDAYDRPVWGSTMRPYEDMRDRLRKVPNAFRYLDAAQLVKHAFGLVTDGARKQKPATLVYLFAEPSQLAGRPIPPETLEEHRREVAEFEAAVAGAGVVFHALSYRTWLDSWSSTSPEIASHADAVLARFDP